MKLSMTYENVLMDLEVLTQEDDFGAEQYCIEKISVKGVDITQLVHPNHIMEMEMKIEDELANQEWSYNEDKYD